MGNIYTSKVFINEEMHHAMKEVLESGTFIFGKKTKEFEQRFAELVGVKHAIAISNGTTAIEVVLLSLGIGKDDEVIVPSHTAFPTIEPILRVGAKPIFVDIDEKYYTIDPKLVEAAITPKTKAIIPVHLYGQAADLAPLKELCQTHNIFLIEDCCQAHHALYHGQPVGSFGIAGCFSFYPSKNITVCGEGGMIVTNDSEVERKCRILLHHGQDGTYNHVLLGNNYRLSELHCALGLEQLKQVEYFTRRRREIAALYTQNLQNVSGILSLPEEASYARHVYHLYVIRVPATQRSRIMEELKKEGIFCGIHYPIACHQQKALLNLFPEQSSLPITEKIIHEILTLPIYPLLKDEEVLMICEKLKKALNG